MEQMIEKEHTYYCECCNYKCMYPAHWKQHLECEKHKNNGIRKTRSDKVFEPNCKLCDYTTMKYSVTPLSISLVIADFARMRAFCRSNLLSCNNPIDTFVRENLNVLSSRHSRNILKCILYVNIIYNSERILQGRPRRRLNLDP